VGPEEPRITEKERDNVEKGRSRIGRKRKDSQRLGVGLANLLSSVLLVVTEEFGPEGNVSRLVDTVDISETSGNGEVGGDGVQSSVDIVDVWGLSVEGCVVGVGVVDTVLLTSGDTDFHLEPFWILAFIMRQGGKWDSRSILAIRLKYLTQSAMLSSLDSSERSSM
jgi:hypothetical protein